MKWAISENNPHTDTHPPNPHTHPHPHKHTYTRTQKDGCNTVSPGQVFTVPFRSQSQSISNLLSPMRAQFICDTQSWAKN